MFRDYWSGTSAASYPFRFRLRRCNINLRENGRERKYAKAAAKFDTALHERNVD